MTIVCSFVDGTDGICLKLYGFIKILEPAFPHASIPYER